MTRSWCYGEFIWNLCYVMKLVHISALLILLLVVRVAFAQTVYTTRTGKKYHVDGCQYLRQSKIRTDVASAISNGYTACLVCRPSSKSNSSTSSGNANKNVVSKRCTAATSSGKRCRRMTTNTNGRCYQHWFLKPTEPDFDLQFRRSKNS